MDDLVQQLRLALLKEVLVKLALKEILKVAEPGCPYCEAITAIASAALDAIDDAIERASEDPLLF